MRGQVSLEFIVTMAVAVLMLVIFLAIGADQLTSAFNDKQSLVLNDVCLVLQQELVTASNVHDSYTRNFTLPATIRDNAYTIDQTSADQVGVFTVTARNLQESIRAPECNGTIVRGKNTICTRGGVIYCNTVQCN